jgi:hypothetical protein
MAIFLDYISKFEMLLNQYANLDNSGSSFPLSALMMQVIKYGKRYEMIDMGSPGRISCIAVEATPVSEKEMSPEAKMK